MQVEWYDARWQAIAVKSRYHDITTHDIYFCHIAQH